MRIVKFLSLICFSLASHLGSAEGLDWSWLKPGPWPRLQTESSLELDLAYWQQLHQLSRQADQESWGWEDFNLAESSARSSSARGLAAATLEKNSQRLLDQTPLGRGTRKLDQSLSTTARKRQPAGLVREAPTSKGLEFQVRSTQTKASLRYYAMGAEAILSYQLYNQAFQAEMHRPLGQRWQLVLDHLQSPEEQSQRLSLRWTW